MLITTELVRDVLCNEILQINNLMNSPQSGTYMQMAVRIQNMLNMLMSEQDFVYVPVDAWTTELTTIADEIARKKGASNGIAEARNQCS